jgi:hypothetical protein
MMILMQFLVAVWARAGLVTGAGWGGNRVIGGAGSVANGAGFGVPAGVGVVREAFAAGSDMKYAVLHTVCAQHITNTLLCCLPRKP